MHQYHPPRRMPTSLWAICGADAAASKVSAVAKAQVDEAQNAAKELGISSNEQAFNDGLNQRDGSSRESRSAAQKQMSANPRSIHADEDAILGWLETAANSHRLQEMLAQHHAVEPIDPRALVNISEKGHCCACGKPHALNDSSSNQEFSVKPCGHVGFCKECALSLRKKRFTGFARLFWSETGDSDDEEPGPIYSACPLCDRKCKGVRTHRGQGHTIDSGKENVQLNEVQNTYSQSHLENVLMLKTQETSGIFSQTWSFADGSRSRAPIRAMRLLDLLPQSLWSNAATTTVGSGEVLTRSMSYVSALADEADYGDEVPDKLLPVNQTNVHVVDFDPLLVFTLGASKGQWRDDKSVALMRFLGTPLIDRTNVGVIDVGINVKSLFPIPAFDPNFSASLDDVMVARARDLLEQHKALTLLWSGGIDSTAMVVAFLRATANDASTRSKLLVKYAARSMEENPNFVGSCIESASPPVRFEQLQDEQHIRDAFDGAQIVVTGDPADMLFGTFKIQAAFQRPFMMNSNGVMVENPVWMSLHKPWQEVMPAALHVRGLLLNPGESTSQYPAAAHQWCQWIEPHVNAAPIPIVNAFDFYWWITYSCKYQFDVLRVLRNRNTAAEIQGVFRSFKPFFASPEFDQWCFHNHKSKIADMRVWASYKYPLKTFIYDYDNDKEYFARKTKVSSALMGCGRQIAITEGFEPIAFGAHSLSMFRMTQKYGKNGLDRLLTKEVRQQKHTRLVEESSDDPEVSDEKRAAEAAQRAFFISWGKKPDRGGGGG